MVIENNGVYYHAAWADDEDGTNFSLTEYTGAVYVGNYTDESSVEITEPTAYDWQLVEANELTDDDVELLEDVDVSELADNVEDVEEDTSEIEARTIINDANIQNTQNTSDEGIGNPNELVGTNQGVNGWSASGATLSDNTATIYDVNDDPVDYVIATVTAANAYIYFDAEKLRDNLADDTSDNGFTFSADVKLSNVVDVPVAVMDTDGTNKQIDFDYIDNSPVDDDQDNADAWIFNRSTSDVINDGNGDPIAVSSQVLFFDLSNLGVGDEISIANLKVEGGGLATPWRASLDEVETIANTALSTANNAINLADGVNQHFWYDSAGAHVTDVTQTQYIADPTNAGGNTLITSTGLGVRNGTTQLAAFTGAGAQIGQTGQSRILQDFHSMQMIDKEGNLYFEVKDSRDIYGVAEITDVFKGDGSTRTFSLSLEANNTSYTVTVNDVAASGVTLHTTYFVFTTAPVLGDVIKAVYDTESSDAKAYTLGNRTGNAGGFSVAEGAAAEASGFSSHAEGLGTKTTGQGSHAEGLYTEAGLGGAHAEGAETQALAQFSHAQNQETIANWDAQTVIGTLNEIDQGTTMTHPGVESRNNYGQYAFIIGNGYYNWQSLHPEHRSNAFTVDWAGNVKTAGDVTDGSGNVLSDKVNASSLSVEEVSINATSSTGTFIAADSHCYRWGKVVYIRLFFRNASNVASGSNVWVGTVTGAPKPVADATSGTFYGAHALNGSFTALNAVTVRNSSASAVQIASPNTGAITFTYITNE